MQIVADPGNLDSRIPVTTWALGCQKDTNPTKICDQPREGS